MSVDKSPDVDLTVVTIAVKSEEKDTFTNKKIVAEIVRPNVSHE